MTELDFYEGLKIIRKATEPMDITYVSLSLSKNEGGELKTLFRQLPGPIKKNTNSKYMIGLQNADTGELVHIYIHSLLSIKLSDNREYKLVLN
jgi:hypothetical protein